MRSLSVRIEEIETNSVATSKRTIQKMEVRIEELQTKTRSIEELILQLRRSRK